MKDNNYILLIHKYLSGEISRRENDELEHWLDGKPENREEFEEIKLIWDNADFKNFILGNDPEEGLREILGRIDLLDAKEGWKREVPFTRGKILKIAAVVLLLIGFSFMGWFLSNSFNDKPVTITNNYQYSKIHLPDGSLVHLNKESSFTFHQRSGKREARLEGEAYFEIVKDENKPFFLYLQDASIKVLGTSFNVNAYDEKDAMEVVVTSGSVEFLYGSQKVKLTPGEKVVLNKGEQRISKIENKDPNFDSWKTGKLQFRNVRLDVILKTLESYYKVPFQMDNDKLLSCRFTGIFKNEKPEEVLKVLSFGLHIQYRYADGKYILSGEGCGQ